jgi:hypothetical protein
MGHCTSVKKKDQTLFVLVLKFVNYFHSYNNTNISVNTKPKLIISFFFKIKKYFYSSLNVNAFLVKSPSTLPLLLFNVVKYSSTIFVEEYVSNFISIEPSGFK